MQESVVSELASNLSLGGVLDAVRQRFGRYDLVAHWTQGEFHHDVLLAIEAPTPRLPGPFLLIATNCNGGVKEVLCFGEAPQQAAVWHWRCPEVAEFSGDLPPVLDRAVTVHWFDPCELLRPDARSELKVEFRQRQLGGGWQMAPSACSSGKKNEP